MWGWRIHVHDGKLSPTVIWGLNQAYEPGIDFLKARFSKGFWGFLKP
jgi:hypothetical protein